MNQDEQDDVFDALNAAINSDAVGFKSAVTHAIQQRIHDNINDLKQEVAQQFFAPEEEGQE